MKVSPVTHLNQWILVLVQKDSNVKKESYYVEEPQRLFTTEFTTENKEIKKMIIGYLVRKSKRITWDMWKSYGRTLLKNPIFSWRSTDIKILCSVKPGKIWYVIEIVRILGSASIFRNTGMTTIPKGGLSG